LKYPSQYLKVSVGRKLWYTFGRDPCIG